MSWSTLTDLLVHKGSLDAVHGHIPWSEVAEELEEQLPLLREALAWTLCCFIILPVVGTIWYSFHNGVTMMTWWHDDIVQWCHDDVVWHRAIMSCTLLWSVKSAVILNYHNVIWYSDDSHRTSQICPGYQRGWYDHQSPLKHCHTPRTGQIGYSHLWYADPGSISAQPTYKTNRHCIVISNKSLCVLNGAAAWLSHNTYTPLQQLCPSWYW